MTPFKGRKLGQGHENWKVSVDDSGEKPVWIIRSQITGEVAATCWTPQQVSLIVDMLTSTSFWTAL